MLIVKPKAFNKFVVSFLLIIINHHGLFVKGFKEKKLIFFMLYLKGNYMPQRSKLNLLPLDLGKETIGERITRLRKERGLTQKELAEKIGLIQVLVSKYELGKLKLSAEMAARFAKALGISTDEIIGLSSNGKENYTPDLKLVKRIRKIKKLPEYKQKIILSMIDAYLRDNLPKE